jgi:hypothetical protein
MGPSDLRFLLLALGTDICLVLCGPQYNNVCFRNLPKTYSIVRIAAWWHRRYGKQYCAHATREEADDSLFVRRVLLELSLRLQVAVCRALEGILYDAG